MSYIFNTTIMIIIGYAGNIMYLSIVWFYSNKDMSKYVVKLDK